MTTSATPGTLAALRAAADGSRLRLLRLLDREELNLSELAAATSMTQSSVSRHVAALRGAGLVEERAEGVRTYLRVASVPPAETAALLAAVLGCVRSEGFGHAEDLVRLERLHREREGDRESFFDELAADWDTLRTELFHGRLSAAEIASLLVPDGLKIVDGGTGTGLHLPWLSAVAGPLGRVIAVERSAAMAARAKERAASLPNVEVRRGRIEELPVEDGWADALVLSLSIGQTSDPARALANCVRAVRPGGRVVVAEVEAHGDRTLVERLGRGFTGFTPDSLCAMMRAAGLDGVRRVDLGEVLPPETNGHRPAHPKGRSHIIPKLNPLLVAGTVPAAARHRKRRTP